MSKHPRKPDPIKQGVSVPASSEAGESLQQLVERVGPLPWALVRWFALRISETLEPLHAKGMAHGGISVESIRLTRPWPNLEVTLGQENPTPGRAIDDLRMLGETMEWLLCCGKTHVDHLAGASPDAVRIIKALAEGDIPDAESLGGVLLDSLSEENEASELSRESNSGPTLLGGIPASWKKIAVAAALAAFLGAGSYFMFKPGAENTAGRVEEARLPIDATPAPLPPSDSTTNNSQSSTKIAEELAAKEAAAKELAEKEQAAKARAAKEAAAMEQAAMEAARDKAMKEKAAQDDALVSKNGKILEDSNATPEEKEQAFTVILSLAREENVNAIELCGASYWQGKGVRQDKETARIWFEKGAGFGNARSMLGLGYCYDQAIGGPRDLPKAVEWWTKAANLGYEVAMSRLGDYFYLNPDAKNVTKAMEWWQKAAEADSPSADAMINLGIIYAKGIDTGKDLQKAVKWWQMAADLGAPEAMTELGIVYFNADIQGKQADAFPLFLKAAEAGSLRAMYGLEACYRKGIGIGKNPKEADRWARIASEKEKGAGR